MTTDLILLPAFIPERIAFLGVDIQQVLQHAGLPAKLFDKGRVRVSTRQFFSLWAALEAAGAPPDFGLRAGTMAPPPGQYDIASMAAFHSTTFREALMKLGRYKRLVCPEMLSIDVQNGQARVQLHWLLAEDQMPPSLLTDSVFASILALLTRGTGKHITPLRVELTRPRQNEALLKQHFGGDIVFDATHDRLVFAAEVLDEPFLVQKPELLDMLVPGLDSVLPGRTVSSPWVEQARESISHNMRGQRPSVESVARDLCVSPRTLQRRLEEADTSYQQLLDDVRHGTARRLLASTELEPGEIAFLLGFEELNSFTRAFSGWEGATPLRWRTARLASPKSSTEADFAPVSRLDENLT